MYNTLHNHIIIDVKTLILLGLTSLFLFIGNSCNYPETIKPAEAEFILPPDSSVIYRFTRHYFITVPGDTALFYGARRCTVAPQLGCAPIARGNQFPAAVGPD